MKGLEAGKLGDQRLDKVLGEGIDFAQLSEEEVGAYRSFMLLYNGNVAAGITVDGLNVAVGMAMGELKARGVSRDSFYNIFIALEELMANLGVEVFSGSVENCTEVTGSILPVVLANFEVRMQAALGTAVADVEEITLSSGAMDVLDVEDVLEEGK